MKWTLFLLLVVGAVVLAAAQDLEEDNELFAEDQQDEASTVEDNSSTEEDEDDQVNLRVVRSAAAQSEGTGRGRNRGSARGNAEQQQGDRRRRGEGKGIQTQLLRRTWILPPFLLLRRFFLYRLSDWIERHFIFLPCPDAIASLPLHQRSLVRMQHSNQPAFTQSNIEEGRQQLRAIQNNHQEMQKRSITIHWFSYSL